MVHESYQSSIHSISPLSTFPWTDTYVEYSATDQWSCIWSVEPILPYTHQSTSSGYLSDPASSEGDKPLHLSNISLPNYP